MTAHQFSPGLFTRGFTPPLKLSDFKLVISIESGGMGQALAVLR